MQYIGSYFIYLFIAYIGDTIVYTPYGELTPLTYMLFCGAVAFACNFYAIRKKKSMPKWCYILGGLVILFGIYWFVDELGSLIGFFDALGVLCCGASIIWYTWRRQKLEYEDQKTQSVFMDENEEKEKKLDIF